MADKVIYHLAHIWADRMPPSSIYGADDLIQEGFIVRMEMERDKKFNPDEGTRFSTFLWTACVWHFNFLRKMELRRVDGRVEIAVPDDEDDGLEQFEQIVTSQAQLHIDRTGIEDQVMLSQALYHMAQISQEFVDMIVNGIPQELYFLAKNHERMKRFKNGWPILDGCFRVNKSMIEKFFGIDLKKLRGLFYNNV